MFQNTHKILLSPLFLSGLFLLVLNDFYLKAEFHNFLTGKISDFAGLFIFPIFFAALYPKCKLEIYFLTGILFVFWKSSFSQSLFDLINNFGAFRIGRTIDYTDLSALIILPVSYFFLQSKTKLSRKHLLTFNRRVASVFVILLSVFAFTATTLVKDRSVELGSDFNSPKSKSEIEQILKTSPNIRNLRIRSNKELFPGDPNVNSEESKNTFFVDFTVHHKICESENVKLSFIITQKTNELSRINPGFARYECSLYEDNSIEPKELEKQQKDELEKVFENEIGEKLRQNNSR